MASIYQQFVRLDVSRSDQLNRRNFAQAIANRRGKLDQMLSKNLREQGLACYQLIVNIGVEVDGVMVRRKGTRIAIAGRLNAVFHRTSQLQRNVLRSDRLAEKLSESPFNQVFQLRF